MSQKSKTDAALETLADKATVEKMLAELSKESLDEASGCYDEYYGGDFGSASCSYQSMGCSYQSASCSSEASSYNYDTGYSANQQVAAAHCMICGARCGSWGDGPVPTGSQGGRRIG